MAFRIIWTESALRKFKQILKWLVKNWSEKTAENFGELTEKRLQQISQMPESGTPTEEENVRKVLITKHNWLFYRIGKQVLYILAIFDSRQKPRKTPK